MLANVAGNCARWRPSAPRAQQARTLRVGEAGSCTCNTSKSPSLIQRRTRAADTGPKFTLATEPLYGTETGLPRRRRTARVGTRVVNRRKHADVVAEAAQSDRKVVDVGLDTAGRGPVIGADDAYLHRRRRGSRSARNTGCSMCQCCGWVAIPSAS